MKGAVVVVFSRYLLIVLIVAVTVANSKTSECNDENSFDVVVVGGGPSGLQSVLTFGRAMLKTLMIDAGTPRNWMVKEFHNFLGHDGENPNTFRKSQRAHIQKQYGDFVKFADDTVTSITGISGDFAISTQTNKSYRASKIVLALGVTEDIPAFPKQYSSQYDKTIFQCPFCHGFEVRGKKFAVISPPILEYATMMKRWTSDVVVFTNGTNLPWLNEENRAKLEKASIAVEEAPIVDIETSDNLLQSIVLQEKKVQREIIFHKFKTHQQPLVKYLNLDLDAMGNVKTHPLSLETSIPGISAIGDMITPFHGVAIGVGMGVQAASFIVRDFPLTQEVVRK